MFMMHKYIACATVMLLILMILPVIPGAHADGYLKGSDPVQGSIRNNSYYQKPLIPVNKEIKIYNNSTDPVIATNKYGSQMILFQRNFNSTNSSIYYMMSYTGVTFTHPENISIPGYAILNGNLATSSNGTYYVVYIAHKYGSINSSIQMLPIYSNGKTKGSPYVIRSNISTSLISGPYIYISANNITYVAYEYASTVYISTKYGDNSSFSTSIVRNFTRPVVISGVAGYGNSLYIAYSLISNSSAPTTTIAVLYSHDNGSLWGILNITYIGSSAPSLPSMTVTGTGAAVVAWSTGAALYVRNIDSNSTDEMSDQANNSYAYVEPSITSNNNSLFLSWLKGVKNGTQYLWSLFGTESYNNSVYFTPPVRISDQSYDYYGNNSDNRSSLNNRSISVMYSLYKIPYSIWLSWQYNENETLNMAPLFSDLNLSVFNKMCGCPITSGQVTIVNGTLEEMSAINADGNSSFIGIPAGQYNITITSNRFNVTHYAIDLNLSSLGILGIGTGPILPSIINVTIAVYAEGTGTPLPGTTIIITPPNSSRLIYKTDDYGMAYLKNMTPGVYRLYAYLNGYEPYVTTENWSTAMNYTVSVDLNISIYTYNGNLQTTVINMTGIPVSGAMIVADLHAPAGYKYTGYTNNSGMLLFRGLNTGRYTIIVSYTGYINEYKNITVYPNITSRVTVVLYRSNTTTSPGNTSSFAHYAGRSITDLFLLIFLITVIATPVIYATIYYSDRQDKKGKQR